MPLFGLGSQKPHHYREMVADRVGEPRSAAVRVAHPDATASATAARSAPPGCRDWTLPGTHLCMVRLELMRLNTAPALDPAVARRRRRRCRRDRRRICARSAGCPSRCCAGAASAGFRVVTWDEALDRSPRRLRAVDPRARRLLSDSRGITNEVYYAAQKAARFLGTNHVDNSARLCHAASTVGDEGDARLRRVDLQLRRLAHADLIVLFGSNVAEQPAGHDEVPAPREGTAARRSPSSIRIASPGSSATGCRRSPRARSAAPRSPTTGSTSTPAATSRFSSACCARSIEIGGVDEAFVARRTRPASTRRATRALATDWDALERESGATRDGCEAFARLLIDRPNAVFVWSMGLTQHAHGVDTIKALVNVASRAACRPAERGLVPIRGHSGVQGGAEVGCLPRRQLISVERRQESGHVFDAERVGSQILQLFCHIDKPLHAVNGADGIADGGFDMFATGFHFPHGPFDVADIIQGVENAEDVDAVGGGSFDKPFQHIVGIVPIADEILPAEQHLKFGVGHGGAQRAEPFPGIFFEKAQAGVERGATPDFEGPIADGVELLGDGQHVLCSHARGQERLMAVAQGDIGDQDRLARRRLNGRLCACTGACFRRPDGWSGCRFLGACVREGRRVAMIPLSGLPGSTQMGGLMRCGFFSLLQPFVGGDGGGECQHQILWLLEVVIVEQVGCVSR